MKNKYKSQVREILKRFDFKKVRKAMVALEWSYAYTGDRVPSVKELRHTATEILIDVANDKKKSSFIGTGGFIARKENGFLALAFEVEECNTDLR